MKIAGSVALVTGAGQGLGHPPVQEFWDAALEDRP